MFNLSTRTKKSFYNQTGNFQFNINLIADSLLGGINFGVSGSGQKINFNCSSGKIIDNNGKFISIYNTNEQFSISGNVTSGSYDYFINGFPVSYGNSKSSSGFNYFYLEPYNINCQYNLFINGERPVLSTNPINIFSGNPIGSGFIINNSLFPIKIFSGSFTNFSSDPPFTLSGLFTGDLNNSGVFYINQSGGDSVGNYTGNLQLFTNGGTFNLNSIINITGSPSQLEYSLSLDGPNVISDGGNQLYYSNIQYLSGSGMGLLVSLEYISGSGNFYTSIPVTSGFSGNISGYISNFGILNQFKTGIGTGIGGQLNNSTTGFVSGYISGDLQYATGTFVWPYSVLVTGYGTGVNYSGLGTGIQSVQITGTIISGSGIFSFDNSVTNSISSLKSVGATGYIHGTGSISFNTPVSLDKLYVGSQSNAIIFGFHYSNITGLTNYLNANTGTHLVTAINNGVNTVTLSGIYGASTNAFLGLDISNAGNMSISGPSLVGGLDLGVGQNLVSSIATGYINNIFTGSGYYMGTGQGSIDGSGNVLDYTKTFTGTWNLFTGVPFQQINYWYQNYFNVNKDKYLNNLPAYYINSTAYTNVSYTNPFDNLVDVALLRVSGYNLNSGLSILISGNG